MPLLYSTKYQKVTIVAKAQMKIDHEPVKNPDTSYHRGSRGGYPLRSTYRATYSFGLAYCNNKIWLIEDAAGSAGD